MKKLDGPLIAPRSGKASSAVIFLHGYGSNGDDLIAIGQGWAGYLPDTVFLSPHAPDVCEAFSAGYQWFSIRAIDQNAGERERQTAATARILDAFIDEQLGKWNVPESSVVVTGFSQGAMMAMYTMPRRKTPCAGVIGYSGMLIDAAGLKAPGIVKMPVLAIHGGEDDVVLPAALKGVEEGFSAAGFDVETIMRPNLDHSIDQFGLQRGLEFTRKALKITEP